MGGNPSLAAGGGCFTDRSCPTRCVTVQLSLRVKRVSAGRKPFACCRKCSISACEKAKHWEEAIRLLQEMLRRWLQEMLHRSLTPYVESYSTVISACEKGKQWGEALCLLQEMLHRCALRKTGFALHTPVILALYICFRLLQEMLHRLWSGTKLRITSWSILCTGLY